MLSKRAVARTTILGMVLILSFLVMGKLAWGTEAQARLLRGVEHGWKPSKGK